MTDQNLADEKRLAEASDAPRVTLSELEANIVAENYINLGKAAEALGQPATEGMHLTTLCVLTLKNGFTVSGQSACASPDRYDEQIGNEFAKREAVRAIWPLMGYALKEKLHNDYAGNSIRIDPVEDAARAAHEANRAIQAEFGEEVAPPWDEAPAYMRESTRSGVQQIIENPQITPEQLHELWAEDRRAAGWVYGPAKDEALKTHHCLVPYNQLPEFQKKKDAVFRETVLTALNIEV